MPQEPKISRARQMDIDLQNQRVVDSTASVERRNKIRALQEQDRAWADSVANAQRQPPIAPSSAVKTQAAPPGSTTASTNTPAPAGISGALTTIKGVAPINFGSSNSTPATGDPKAYQSKIMDVLTTTEPSKVDSVLRNTPAFGSETLYTIADQNNQRRIADAISGKVDYRAKKK